MSSLKNKVAKLESSEKSSGAYSLVEALNAAKVRLNRREKSPAPTITESELRDIIAMNGNTLTAEVARARLRMGFYVGGNYEH
jgi:triphosphoribosyl-dephospho-CoA synthetase